MDMDQQDFDQATKAATAMAEVLVTSGMRYVREQGYDPYEIGTAYLTAGATMLRQTGEVDDVVGALQALIAMVKGDTQAH